MLKMGSLQYMQTLYVIVNTLNSIAVDLFKPFKYIPINHNIKNILILISWWTNINTTRWY